MVCLKLVLLIVLILLVVFIILYVKCAHRIKEQYSTPGTLGGIGQSYVSPNMP